MKVFVFKPSNENIGKFNIDTFEGLHSAFRTFAETHDVAPNDYLECSGQSWTAIKGVDGLKLADGRLPQTPQRTTPESPEEVDSSEPESASRYPMLRTLSTIYRIFAYVTGIFAVIIVIFGIVKIDRGGVSLIIFGALGGVIGVITNLAIAEGIKVFIGIEENTRNTFLSISRQNNHNAEQDIGGNS